MYFKVYIIPSDVMLHITLHNKLAVMSCFVYIHIKFPHLTTVLNSSAYPSYRSVVFESLKSTVLTVLLRYGASEETSSSNSFALDSDRLL